MKDYIFNIINNHVQETKGLRIKRVGGMTNLNYRVDTDTNSYILRIPHKGTDKFITRKTERKNYQAILPLEITPKILYFCESGIKVTYYLHDSVTCTKEMFLYNPQLRLSIISLIKKLHHSQVVFKNVFNVFKEIKKYEKIINQYEIRLRSEYYELKGVVDHLYNKWKKMPPKMAPCHNDLVPENFLFCKDKKIFWLDWEYSGMNDPVWDLASFFLEGEISKENKKILLESYFEGLAPGYVEEKIEIYTICMDVLWYLWTEVMANQGITYNDYGEKRLIRGYKKSMQIK